MGREGFRTKGHIMVSKLREGIRQDVPAETTMEDLAMFDLAASGSSSKGEKDLLGPALVLLANRNCTPRCPVEYQAAFNARARLRLGGLTYP